MAEDGSDEPGGESTRPDRDSRGRFAPGWRGGPGRPRGQSISAEMRRQADPEAIAAFVLGVIHNPNASVKERLRAAELVQDRLEGKAVARSVTMRLGASLLPVGFEAMPIEARRQYLQDLRTRALAGELSTAVDAETVDDE